jgi:hypothetical protein
MSLTDRPHAVARSARRGRLVRAFFVAVVVIQIGLVIRGYSDPHKFFAFQPFNESSEWRADIVRVTVDGERVPIDEPWPGGYDWDEMVGWGVLQRPAVRKHAYSGAGASLDFLDEAIDWVADHTPDDHETLYLEADVTYWVNTRGPQHLVLRSDDRDEAP